MGTMAQPDQLVERSAAGTTLVLASGQHQCGSSADEMEVDDMETFSCISVLRRHIRTAFCQALENGRLQESLRGLQVHLNLAEVEDEESPRTTVLEEATSVGSTHASNETMSSGPVEMEAMREKLKNTFLEAYDDGRLEETLLSLCQGCEVPTSEVLSVEHHAESLPLDNAATPAKFVEPHLIEPPDLENPLAQVKGLLDKAAHDSTLENTLKSVRGFGSPRETSPFNASADASLASEPSSNGAVHSLILGVLTTVDKGGQLHDGPSKISGLKVEEAKRCDKRLDSSEVSKSPPPMLAETREAVAGASLIADARTTQSRPDNPLLAASVAKQLSKPRSVRHAKLLQRQAELAQKTLAMEDELAKLKALEPSSLTAPPAPIVKPIKVRPRNFSKEKHALWETNARLCAENARLNSELAHLLELASARSFHGL